MTERARHSLHSRLQEVLGPDEAVGLMEAIPPMSWNEVATRETVGNLGDTLRLEMSNTAQVLRAEMAEMRDSLRNEMGDLRDSLRNEMGDLRNEITEIRVGVAGVRTEIADLRSETHGLHAGLLKSQRDLVFAFIGANATIAALTVTVVQLLN